MAQDHDQVEEAPLLANSAEQELDGVREDKELEPETPRISSRSVLQPIYSAYFSEHRHHKQVLASR